MRRIVVLFLVSLMLSGCATRHFTNTPRAAIEQMLLSGAVDAALAKFQLPELAGKKTFVDFSNLKAYDPEYIKVAVRARLACVGATLVDSAEQAEYAVEVASGAQGTEFKSTMFGIPAIPVPQTGGTTSELPFFRDTEQTGIIKLLLFVHRKGEFVAADLYYAKCDRGEKFILGWRTVRKDDIREGWERADLNLKARLAEPKGGKQ